MTILCLLLAFAPPELPDATLKVRDLCLDLLGKPSGPEKNVPRGTETSGGLSCF